MSPAGAVRAPRVSPDPAQWPLGTAPGTALTLPLGSGTPGLPQLRNPMHNGHLGGVYPQCPRGSRAESGPGTHGSDSLTQVLIGTPFPPAPQPLTCFLG